jgi:hypothetical protein
MPRNRQESERFVFDDHPHACSVDCSRTLVWAKGDSLSVLTLAGGNAFVTIADHPSSNRWDVLYVAVTGQSGKQLGSFNTETGARKCAVRAAHKYGLDDLAFPGHWRGRTATAQQRRALRSHDIAHPRGISSGRASALIALDIVHGFIQRRAISG